MQVERRTKQIYLFFIPKRSLPYQKVMQVERRTKQIYLFFIFRTAQQHVRNAAYLIKQNQ